MTNSHKKRIRQIANIALPPKGTSEYDSAIKLLQKYRSKEEDEYISDLFKQSLSIVTGQQLNGAGHQTDQAIRHFHNEYNYRCWEHGLLHSFPSSFNVAESFFDYRLNTFIIYDELNHLFSFPDFIDWYTACDQSFEYQEALDFMEEGIIYTFDDLLDPADLLYNIENGGEVAVSGFATVRFDKEVTVMCVGGEKTDIEQKNKEFAQKIPDYKPAPFKNDINPDPSRPVEAVTLDSKLPLWKLLTLIRFETENMSQADRYIFHDIGNSFLVTTDSPTAVFDNKGEPLWKDVSVEKLLKSAAKKTRGYNALFDLCASALFLPLYFAEHSVDVVVERFETDYAKELRKASFQKIKKNIPIKQRIAHRNVNVIRGQDNDRNLRETIYSAQNFHIETSGYWGTLQPGKYGIDKKGSPIHGRTWISKKLSWMEADEPSTLKAKGYTCHSLPEGPNPGYIYIMRSPLHEKGVFKIGLTTRSADIRANELSSATGVPGRVFVINQWAVSDCKTIERKIHNQLAEYRVDPRREFFQGSLEYFMKIVNSIIREIEGL